jgi:hypothetical protein
MGAPYKVIFVFIVLNYVGIQLLQEILIGIPEIYPPQLIPNENLEDILREATESICPFHPFSIFSSLTSQ